MVVYALKLTINNNFDRNHYGTHEKFADYVSQGFMNVQGEVINSRHQIRNHQIHQKMVVVCTDDCHVV